MRWRSSPTGSATAGRLPVTIAILGISPSDLRLGSDVWLAASGVSAHSLTTGTLICRRHLPIWITSGTSVPTGTSSITNSPLALVSAEATGLPDTGVAQVSHRGPVGMSASVVLGT